MEVASGAARPSSLAGVGVLVVPRGMTISKAQRDVWRARLQEAGGLFWDAVPLPGHPWESAAPGALNSSGKSSTSSSKKRGRPGKGGAFETVPVPAPSILVSPLGGPGPDCPHFVLCADCGPHAEVVGHPALPRARIRKDADIVNFTEI